MAAKGVVCVRVGADLLERVDEAAARARVNRSAWMLGALEARLKREAFVPVFERPAWPVYDSAGRA